MIGRISLEIEGATAEQIERYLEILKALLEKGALDGVKNGKTIIHFNHEGIFQGIQLDYWPWRRREK